MEWQDEGIIIGTRRHGETSLIVEIMTRNHGRHMGLARGGRSRKKHPFYQPGNSVEAIWRARLDEHLGTWALEATELRMARLMETPVGIFGLQTMAAHLRLLPERDVHAHLYEALEIILSHLDNPPVAAALIIRFELALLDDLGFGLDLSKCAATGTAENLTHVSPKTGRAVSRAAAEPWLDRLLPLPAFLISAKNRDQISNHDMTAGFDLAGHFLTRHVYQPRGIEPPNERASFIKAVMRQLFRDTVPE
jgi:DNA repair protein RecO (recombination protein O)